MCISIYRRNFNFTNSLRAYRFDDCSSIQNVIPFVIIHLTPEKHTHTHSVHIICDFVCVSACCVVFDFSDVFSPTIASSFARMRKDFSSHAKMNKHCAIYTQWLLLLFFPDSLQTPTYTIQFGRLIFEAVSFVVVIAAV